MSTVSGSAGLTHKRTKLQGGTKQNWSNYTFQRVQFKQRSKNVHFRFARMLNKQIASGGTWRLTTYMGSIQYFVGLNDWSYFSYSDSTW